MSKHAEGELRVQRIKLSIVLVQEVSKELTSLNNYVTSSRINNKLVTFLIEPLCKALGLEYVANSAAEISVEIAQLLIKQGSLSTWYSYNYTVSTATLKCLLEKLSYKHLNIQKVQKDEEELLLGF